MTTWQWIDPAAIFDYHAAVSGSTVLNENSVLSAIARPENLAAYGSPGPDAADLAAAYAFGLIRNHGFLDGNKRTAWMAAAAFLEGNGHQLAFTTEEAVEMVTELANHQLSEQEVAAWFRQRIS